MLLGRTSCRRASNLMCCPKRSKPSYNRLFSLATTNLVLEADSPLEKSAGISLTFLLTLEILDQFAFAPQLNLRAPTEAEASEVRERAMARHLRLITAKQKVSSFLLRLRELRSKEMLVLGGDLA